MILLDTSAVLGYLNDEPGRDVVATVLVSGEARISLVNQTEVLSKLCDWGMSFENAKVVLGKLAIPFEAFTTETALEAARLRSLTRAHGLSLGDRACLATARLCKLDVLTGDRPWLEVAQILGLNIINFRPDPH